MRNIILIVLIVLFASLNHVSAQEADTTSRPKIGLVLSGGAAKGLAHIGVLRVLEEVGIMPDYIAGTSMGAVVGGLYALGYTADEIAELNTNADWDDLLSDRLPLDEVVFEEKYEYKRYIMGFPIRNYKFKLPSGMIEGQQLEKFFTGLMWPLPKLESYDSLSVPFRCMAVDLISGKLVEFSSGNLAESVRASMAIPTIFSPECIDSMLLVDGGVIRNFPVEEVRKMGADYVIGVYVGFEDKVTVEDLFSLSEVMSRATVFYGIYDSQEQIQMADLVIQPDLQGLGATDFSKSKRIEILGEIAALEMQSELYKLADSLNAEYTPIKRTEQPEKILISAIDVINTRFVQKDFIIKRSGITENTYVSREDVSQGVDKIFGTQYFRKVTYNLEKLDDNSYKLIFNVKESTRAFLNFAAHYDNQYGPGLITNLTLRNYLAPSSRAILSFNIAENPGIRLDINKYIGKSEKVMDNYFFNWNQSENLYYENGIDLGSYKSRVLSTGGGGKYSISVNQQIGILGMYEMHKIIPNGNIKNLYQVESFESYSYNGFAYKLYYNLNTTDDNFFPRKGVKLDLWYKYNFKPNISYNISEADKQRLNDIVFFSDQEKEYYTAHFNIESYTGIFDKLIFNIGASLGISSDESISTGSYVIGGYHWDTRLNYIPFAGMNYAEAIVTNYGLLKTGIDLEVLPKIYITARANVGFYADSQDEYIDFIKTSPLKSYLKGYCAGIWAETFIGPINMMYGDNDYDGNVRWYLSIGYPF